MSELHEPRYKLDDHTPFVFINRALEVSTDDANSVRRVAISLSNSEVRLSSNACQ